MNFDLLKPILYFFQNMFLQELNSSEEAYLAKLGLGTQGYVAGCPQPSWGSFAAGSIELRSCRLLPAAAAGQKAASQSEKRCRVGLCAWATEMIRYNFSNHCECDPDCHCLGMCLRLSFRGPE